MGSRTSNMTFPCVMKVMKVLPMVSHFNNGPHSIGPQNLVFHSNDPPIQSVPPFNRSPNSGQIVRAYHRPMDAIFMFI